MSNSIPNYTLQEIKFLGSFPSIHKAPVTGIPEFAFIGRSNVGKSSLINYICDRKKLAKTSSTPGKTQHINLFNIDEKWVLADLPGYGYAKISKKIKGKFGAMIENYLLQRSDLVTAFLLLDLRHDPQEVDIQQMRWLGEKGVPFSVIFTKTDKLKEHAVEKQVEQYIEKLQMHFEFMPNHFISSASGRKGKEDILDYINYVAGTK
ncbi:UNVERIFIED_CONTAM: hypothetical protein GTU68_038509 [Idotea baltica]|nr:hypothetical protein [Idotea baltica]